MVQISLIIGLFMSFGAQAQWLGEFQGDRRAHETPRLNPSLWQSRPLGSEGASPAAVRKLTPAELELAAQVGAALQATFTAQLQPLQSAKPKCDAPEAGVYALALKTKGELEACRDFAWSCRSSRSRFAARLWYEGAQCGALFSDHQAAHALFDAATADAYKNEDFFEVALFQFASYARSSPYQDEVPAILARSSKWSPREQELVLALVEKASQGRTTRATADEIEKYLQSRVALRSGLYEEVLRSLQFQILLDDFEHSKALKHLAQNFQHYANPLHWYFLAFQVFYEQDLASLALAKTVYDAAVPFLHGRSRLPLEQNVFNYSQLYQGVCAGSLLQGVDRQSFLDLKANWRAARISDADFRRGLEALPEAANRADVLTVIGGLEFMAQDFSAARRQFWRAHELCPYYNRAHWGLALVSRQIRYESFPDHDDLLKKMNSEIDSLELPKATERYFANWKVLGTEAQRRVRFGSRIWVNDLEALSSAQLSTYIKFPFDLLSEVPGLKSVRDLRITYPNDNRLWDDVRGLGGEIVVSDVVETMQTVFGAYNLLGHEMTHQFHGLVAKVDRRLDVCNQKLYNAAKARNLFPDAYSALNTSEYFAQGVTYYLVAPDAHPRFGLNRNWIEKNDPDQFKFISSIVAAKGDLAQIRCPL